MSVLPLTPHATRNGITLKHMAEPIQVSMKGGKRSNYSGMPSHSMLDITAYPKSQSGSYESQFKPLKGGKRMSFLRKNTRKHHKNRKGTKGTKGTRKYRKSYVGGFWRS